MNQNQTMDKRETKRGDYRGNPILILPLGENRDFSFGVGKARVILDCVDQIRAFVSDHEPGPEAEARRPAPVAANAGR